MVRITGERAYAYTHRRNYQFLGIVHENNPVQYRPDFPFARHWSGRFWGHNT